MMNIANKMKNISKVLGFLVAVGAVCAASNVIGAPGDDEGQSAPSAKTEPTTVKTERLVHPMGKPPFLYKDLGANWQYANDADKLPLIRAAFKSERLRKHYFKPDDNPVCKTFPDDFMKGNFEVINPDFEALSNNDPRLGKPIPYGETSNISYEDKQRGLANWHYCDGASPSDSTATDPYMVFTGLFAYGEPPYRIYRIKGKDGTKMDIALVRESNGLKPPKWKIDGYGQDYYLVNLAGCEILGVRGLLSPVIQNNRVQDVISLLIRYQGTPLVLAYFNWARPGEPNRVEVMLANLHSDPKSSEICDWTFPNTFK